VGVVNRSGRRGLNFRSLDWDCEPEVRRWLSERERQRADAELASAIGAADGAQRVNRYGMLGAVIVFLAVILLLLF